MSLKKNWILFTHFEELRKKWPKNAQKRLKLSKIAGFRLSVNERPVESNQNNSNKKLVNRMNRQ